MDSQVRERILQICTELGEDVDSPSCEAIKEYIKQCPKCEAFVDSVKKTIKMYQSYTPQHSKEVHHRLFKVLKLE